ncbi:hypothetical protein ACP3K0_004785, partial [Vibrio parahaemolyticus]
LQIKLQEVSMMIKCPHCKDLFDARNALVKEHKSNYRWYEFSGKETYCPLCNKKYQSDISIIAFILLMSFVLLTSLLNYFEYNWAVGVLIVFCLLAAKKYKKKMFRVTPK